MRPSERESRPGHDEAIEATAAAWLAQADEALTPEDAAAFRQWCDADPRHAAAVARLRTTWTALQALRDYRPEAHVHPDRDLLARPQRRAAWHLGPLLAGAALATVLAVVWLQPAAAPVEAARPVVADEQVFRYATTAGGYERTTLADGSVVELNADAEILVRFVPGERRVELVRGEAHFDVAKDKKRPFWVAAGRVAVRAVGTAFNVRRDDARVEVLVTEGKVQVRVGSTAREAVAKIDSLPLVAGQKTVIPLDATEPLPVEVVPPEKIRDELAWQGRKLAFRETPLAEVAAQFNRFNQLQIELGDASLQSLPVDGSFRTENVEAFLRLLANNPDIAIERPEPNRVILRRAH